MRNLKLEYQDDPTAQELFELAGAALADPADGSRRGDFWKFVDAHSGHPWVAALKRSAAASHPRGLSAGNQAVNTAIDAAHGKPWAGQPDWIRGVFRAFGQ